MFTFEITTGNFRAPNSSLFGKGYSGNGDGKNNPAWEAIKLHGPLPTGLYTAVKMIEHDPHLGWYAIHLKPDASTRIKIISYGRDPDSFYWHGDDIDHPGEASDGCLVSMRSMRLDFWGQEDHVIQCIPGLPISPPTSYPRSL